MTLGGILLLTAVMFLALVLIAMAECRHSDTLRERRFIDGREVYGFRCQRCKRWAPVLTDRITDRARMARYWS